MKLRKSSPRREAERSSVRKRKVIAVQDERQAMKELYGLEKDDFHKGKLSPKGRGTRKTKTSKPKKMCKNPKLSAKEDGVVESEPPTKATKLIRKGKIKQEHGKKLSAKDGVDESEPPKKGRTPIRKTKIKQENGKKLSAKDGVDESEPPIKGLKPIRKRKIKQQHGKEEADEQSAEAVPKPKRKIKQKQEDGLDGETKSPSTEASSKRKQKRKRKLREPTGLDTEICSICNEVFHKMGFGAHLKTHGKSAHCSVICDYCGKEVCDKSELTIHIRKHTGERPFSCDVCGMSFPRASSLNRHIRCVHSDMRDTYQCQYCGRSFKSKTACCNHESFKHEGRERPFKCTRCGKTFAVKCILQEHEERHMGIKTFQCKLCPAAFYRLFHLNRHMRRHTGEKPHICDICSKGFSQLGNLCIHKKTHQSFKKFKCTQCDMGYTRLEYLKRHEMNDHSVLALPGTSGNMIRKIKTKKQSAAKKKFNPGKKIAKGTTGVTSEVGKIPYVEQEYDPKNGERAAATVSKEAEVIPMVVVEVKHDPQESKHIIEGCAEGLQTENVPKNVLEDGGVLIESTTINPSTAAGSSAVRSHDGTPMVLGESVPSDESTTVLLYIIDCEKTESDEVTHSTEATGENVTNVITDTDVQESFEIGNLSTYLGETQDQEQQANEANPSDAIMKAEDS